MSVGLIASASIAIFFIIKKNVSGFKGKIFLTRLHKTKGFPFRVFVIWWFKKKVSVFKGKIF
jgi:hypothetical protein